MIFKVAIGMFQRHCDDLQIRRATVILLAPGVCFLIGFGSFLAHEHLVFHYSWLFAIAAIPAFSLLPSVLNKMLLIVPLPAAALVFKVFCLNAICQTVGTPPLNSGFPLYSTNGITQMLVDEFSPNGQAIADEDFVIYLNMSTGGGFHFYFSENYPLRAYLADKPYIRPHDVDPFFAKIQNVRGVLIHVSRIGNQEPSAIFKDAFPKVIADAINGRTVKSIRRLGDAFVYVEFEKG